MFYFLKHKKFVSGCIFLFFELGSKNAPGHCILYYWRWAAAYRVPNAPSASSKNKKIYSKKFLLTFSKKNIFYISGNGTFWP